MPRPEPSARPDPLTTTLPGTAGGALMRRYWQPAALVDELDGERPVVPVRLLGEDLVLFRTGDGALGLMQRACPHRGVDLCRGRLEADGLRCAFHGWKFDPGGACVEQPGEPEGSTLHRRVRTTSYPAVARNGIVFAWLGELDANGDPPPLPALDCIDAPATHVFAFKGLWRCNWLQATEIGIDPAHASFLHRFLEDEDAKASYGKQFRDVAGDTDIPMTRLLREYPRPEIRATPTAQGQRLVATRRLDDGRVHERVTHQLFPHGICIPMSRTMNITQWHVPVDDTSCYWYSMFTSYDGPVDHATMRAQRLAEHRLPDYAPTKHAGNDYGYDPSEQASATYTGMGMDINVHDQWAVESMGAIQDRAREQLGTTDVAIIAGRRTLREALRAIEAGDEPAAPGTAGSTGPDGGAQADDELPGPPSIDAIARDAAPDDAWRAAARARRDACSWAATSRR